MAKMVGVWKDPCRSTRAQAANRGPPVYYLHKFIIFIQRAARRKAIGGLRVAAVAAAVA